MNSGLGLTTQSQNIICVPQQSPNMGREENDDDICWYCDENLMNVNRISVGERLLHTKTRTYIDKVKEKVPKPPGTVPATYFPDWHNISLDKKIPKIPGPTGTVVYTRGDLGNKLHRRPKTFCVYDPNHRERVVTNYDGLHDPHAQHYFSRPEVKALLIKQGLITKHGQVICSLKEFNHYRNYLRTIYNQNLEEYIKEDDAKFKKAQKQQTGLKHYTTTVSGPEEKQRRHEFKRLKIMEATKRKRHEWSKLMKEQRRKEECREESYAHAQFSQNLQRAVTHCEKSWRGEMYRERVASRTKSLEDRFFQCLRDKDALYRERKRFLREEMARRCKICITEWALAKCSYQISRLKHEDIVSRTLQHDRKRRVAGRRNHYERLHSSRSCHKNAEDTQEIKKFNQRLLFLAEKYYAIWYDKVIGKKRLLLKDERYQSSWNIADSLADLNSYMSKYACTEKATKATRDCCVSSKYEGNREFHRYKRPKTDYCSSFTEKRHNSQDNYSRGLKSADCKKPHDRPLTPMPCVNEKRRNNALSDKPCSYGPQKTILGSSSASLCFKNACMQYLKDQNMIDSMSSMRKNCFKSVTTPTRCCLPEPMKLFQGALQPLKTTQSSTNTCKSGPRLPVKTKSVSPESSIPQKSLPVKLLHARVNHVPNKPSQSFTRLPAKSQPTSKTRAPNKRDEKHISTDPEFRQLTPQIKPTSTVGKEDDQTQVAVEVSTEMISGPPLGAKTSKVLQPITTDSVSQIPRVELMPEIGVTTQPPEQTSNAVQVEAPLIVVPDFTQTDHNKDQEMYPWPSRVSPAELKTVDNIIDNKNEYSKSPPAASSTVSPSIQVLLPPQPVKAQSIKIHPEIPYTNPVSVSQTESQTEGILRNEEETQTKPFPPVQTSGTHTSPTDTRRSHSQSPKVQYSHGYSQTVATPKSTSKHVQIDVIPNVSSQETQTKLRADTIEQPVQTMVSTPALTKTEFIQKKLVENVQSQQTKPLECLSQSTQVTSMITTSSYVQTNNKCPDPTQTTQTDLPVLKSAQTTVIEVTHSCTQYKNADGVQKCLQTDNSKTTAAPLGTVYQSENRAVQTKNLSPDSVNTVSTSCNTCQPEASEMASCMETSKSHCITKTQLNISEGATQVDEEKLCVSVCQTCKPCQIMQCPQTSPSNAENFSQTSKTFPEASNRFSQTCVCDQEHYNQCTQTILFSQAEKFSQPATNGGPFNIEAQALADCNAYFSETEMAVHMTTSNIPEELCRASFPEESRQTEPSPGVDLGTQTVLRHANNAQNGPRTRLHNPFRPLKQLQLLPINPECGEEIICRNSQVSIVGDILAERALIRSVLKNKTWGKQQQHQAVGSSTSDQNNSSGDEPQCVQALAVETRVDNCSNQLTVQAKMARIKSELIQLKENLIKEGLCDLENIPEEGPGVHILSKSNTHKHYRPTENTLPIQAYDMTPTLPSEGFPGEIVLTGSAKSTNDLHQNVAAQGSKPNHLMVLRSISRKLRIIPNAANCVSLIVKPPAEHAIKPSASEYMSPKKQESELKKTQSDPCTLEVGNPMGMENNAQNQQTKQPTEQIPAVSNKHLFSPGINNAHPPESSTQFLMLPRRNDIEESSRISQLNPTQRAEHQVMQEWIKSVFEDRKRGKELRDRLNTLKDRVQSTKEELQEKGILQKTPKPVDKKKKNKKGKENDNKLQKNK